MATLRERLDKGKERAARVLAIVQADPTVSAAKVARDVGVSRQRALQILADLGYELAWRKRRAKRGPSPRPARLSPKAPRPPQGPDPPVEP